MESTVKHNQNLFDISIQENGNAQTIFELALLNGISVTTDVTPKQKLEVKKSDLIVSEIVNYLSNKKYVVATGGASDLVVRPIGIGAMIVENDFIIG